MRIEEWPYVDTIQYNASYPSIINTQPFFTNQLINALMPILRSHIETRSFDISYSQVWSSFSASYA